MRLPVSLFTFLALSLSVTAAQANTVTFDFTISGSGYTGSGVLTGTSDPGNPLAYDSITGSGTLNGSAIALNYTPGVDIANPGVDLFAGTTFDNVIYTSGPAFLDGYGLDFTDGANVVVPYYMAGHGYELYDTSQPFFMDTNPITFSVTQVIATTPEPASLALLATGVMGVAGMARRRMRRA